MEKGIRYKLISFNGTIKPGKTCEPNENYWALIGQSGKLINFSQELKFGDNNRVLLKFDQDITKQGLECHNQVSNALWILKTDLERLDL